MNVIKTDISGILIFEPKIFKDSRGYFFESYSKRQFDEAVGYQVDFVQDNQSCSEYGVVRGLHYQADPFAQAKLVRCIKGTVLDVALDIRRDSKTFGKHIAIELSECNHREIFIPRGFAHGFAVLSKDAIFQYKCDNYYAPEHERGICVLDPTLGIDWKTDLSSAILSERDTKLPLFNALEF